MIPPEEWDEFSWTVADFMVDGAICLAIGIAVIAFLEVCFG